MKMKSSGMPRKLRVRASCVWSADGKACVRSRYAMRISLSCVRVSFMHRLRCDMVEEQE
jgi:hypothetical protein